MEHPYAGSILISTVFHPLHHTREAKLIRLGHNPMEDIKQQSICIAAATCKGSIGGPETWVLRISQWFIDQGVQITVLIVHDGISPNDSGLATLLAKIGVPHHVRLRQNLRSDTGWFLQQIAELKPAMFIANHIAAALFASYNLAGSSLSRVMLVHSDDPIYYKLLDTFVLSGDKPAVDKVVVVSEYLERKLAPVLSSRVEVIRIPYGAPYTHHVAEFNHEVLNLLYVGRFTRQQKRIDDVARAMCMACNSIPGVRGVMLGDGADRALVESIIRSQNCGELVRVEGPLEPEQVIAEMALSQVMVLLSDFEGIPVALQEGMSLGLVPIVTAIESGIPELVIEGKTGYIVADRTNCFVESVRKMKTDASLWQSLSTNARNHFNRNFSQDSVIKRWLVLIPSVEPLIKVADQLYFPITGWKDFWVDGSIVSGLAKLKWMLSRMIWQIWDCIPEPVRIKTRYVLGVLFRYNGFRVSK